VGLALDLELDVALDDHDDLIHPIKITTPPSRIPHELKAELDRCLPLSGPRRKHGANAGSTSCVQEG
jgi:hypothetical protein